VSLNRTSNGCLATVLRYSNSNQHTPEATDPQFIHYGSATVNALLGKSIHKNSPILLASRSSLYDSRTSTGQPGVLFIPFRGLRLRRGVSRRGVSWRGVSREGSPGEGSPERDLRVPGEGSPERGLPEKGLRVSGEGSPEKGLRRRVSGRSDDGHMPYTDCRSPHHQESSPPI